MRLPLAGLLTGGFENSCGLLFRSIDNRAGASASASPIVFFTAAAFLAPPTWPCSSCNVASASRTRPRNISSRPWGFITRLLERGDIPQAVAELVQAPKQFRVLAPGAEEFIQPLKIVVGYRLFIAHIRLPVR